MDESTIGNVVDTVAISFPTYQWEPKPDISTFELAQALPAFLMGSGSDIHSMVSSFPPEVKRHFKRVS